MDAEGFKLHDISHPHRRLHSVFPITVVRQQLHGVHRHPRVSRAAFWSSNRLLAGSVGVEAGRRGYLDGIAGDSGGRKAAYRTRYLE